MVIIGLSLMIYRYFIIDTLSSQDTLWIVDTSLSMAVEDIPGSTPTERMSRLDRAWEIVKTWITSIAGNHAIMSYARSAAIESPLTTDRAHLGHVVDSLQPTLYYWGSDISAALLLAKSLYGNREVPLRIFWIADGGVLPDILPDMPDLFALTLVGVGSPAWGKIPLGYSVDGERRYRSYSGTEVVVRYDSTPLETLANRYDGRFLDFGVDSRDLDSVIDAPVSSSVKNSLLIIFSTFLIIGYFYHPYARKK